MQTKNKRTHRNLYKYDQNIKKQIINISDRTIEDKQSISRFNRPIMNSDQDLVDTNSYSLRICRRIQDTRKSE